MKKEKNVTEQAVKSPLGVRIAKYVTALAVVLVLFWFGCTCVVREGECAVILRFGAVREQVSDAGLYFKLPWPFESTVKYDDRVRYLESDLLETTTNDRRNIVIQSYITWEIEDPVLYHNSVGAQGSVENYIKSQVFNATNSTMGTYEMAALVSLDKEQIKIEQIQQDIFTRVQENCRANYGIYVSDVSILRLSLPDTTLETVFEQMRTDRQNEINIIIDNAYLKATEITSKADADAAEIRGQGQTAAAEIRRETEVAVAEIYNKAYKENIELYKFLKNLDAVVNSINNSTVLIVKIDEYPFNILKEYSNQMTETEQETVISDLTYILTQLSEPDRTALIDAIGALIAAAAQDNGIDLSAGG